ncbi:MAG: PatB family C-S lyase [Campylobacterota bacterium]|nr:PatB family C-S lyase [Campylobacterota bacterium]
MLLYQMQNFDKPIDRSNTNAEKYTKRQELFGTDNVLPMWVADMDLPSPPFVLEAIQKRLNHPIFGYEEMPNSAFEAQINWINDHYGIKIEREMMLYSPSVVTSINMAIEAFSEIGDEIVIQPPIYQPFYSSILFHKRKAILNPLKIKNGQYQMDFEDLEARITAKTKMLLLCSPHNPVGRVWSKEELEKLLTIANRHNIIIVSDEIHSDLVFRPHTPLYKLSDKIITLQGVGKSFNLSGLAISTIIIPDPKIKKHFLATYRRYHLGEGNILSHTAFEVAYHEGKEWVEELKQYIQTNFKLLENLANQYPNQIRFTPPQATYLAWIDFRQMQLDDKSLHQGLIEYGLGLSQGISFKKGGSGFMRMNCAVPHSVMQEATKKLEAFITKPHSSNSIASHTH